MSGVQRREGCGPLADPARIPMVIAVDGPEPPGSDHDQQGGLAGGGCGVGIRPRTRCVAADVRRRGRRGPRRARPDDVAPGCVNAAVEPAGTAAAVGEPLGRCVRPQRISAGARVREVGEAAWLAHKTLTSAFAGTSALVARRCRRTGGGRWSVARRIGDGEEAAISDRTRYRLPSRPSADVTPAQRVGRG